MSQAEDLLNSLVEDDISSYSLNPETEEHITIDSNRKITVPESLRRIAVQYDHNVETVTFDCPRYWDDHDLSQMYIYINYIRGDKVRSRYLAKNVRVSSSDSNVINFEWTIGNEITLAKGTISFSICAVKTDSEGNEELHWNSEINNQMSVSEGLECTDIEVQSHPDVITSLLTKMDNVLSANTPILDTTLSTSGLAADAKVTGDAIRAIGNGAPLVAGSVNEMTDTTRAYVNTTNGHWYYFSGSEWISGGVYQAAEDSTTVDELVADMETVQAEQIDQNGYIAALEAENERLKEDLKGLPTCQATGETLYLEDAASMRVNSFALSGNSYQETRSGKNLLDVINLFPTQTLNGITFTNNGDGTVTVNGTATANAFYTKTMTLKAGTYTLSGCPNGGGDNKYALQILGLSDWDDGDGYTFTLTEETVITIRIMIYSGNIVSNLLFKPMIEEGTTATEYEPYGAMPSPDYPSEVISCGDNVNLFDKTVPIIDTYINNNGEESDDSANGRKFQKTLIENDIAKQYVISFKSKKADESVRFAFYNGDTFISRNVMKDNGGVVSVPANTTKIDIRSDATWGNYGFTDLKIEKGSVVTPYSPYGMGCVSAVVCNKNLINIPTETTKSYGSSTYTVKGTEFIINANNNGLTLRPDKQKIFIPKGTTISLSNTYISGEMVNGYIRVDIELFFKNSTSRMFLNDGHFKTENYKTNNVIKSKTTLEDDVIAYQLAPYIATSPVATDFKIRVQLEQGLTATEYEPHKSQTVIIPTQQPMRKVGDYADEFVKLNGKWYERHNITRIIFDGTESWGSANSDGKVYVFPLTLFSKSEANISNMFQSNLIGYYEKIAIKTAGFNKCYLGIKGERLETTNETGLKKYLANLYNAGTPVYMDYVPENPLDLECTPEQIEVLENIRTYKGTTHMYSTDTIVPTIDVTYKKDVEIMINNILGGN